MAYAYAESKDQILARLRRVEGQVRGIARMVEEDTYCVDVLTQINAVTSALDKVGLQLLSSHIKGCVKDAVAADGGDEKVAELVGVVERFLKA
jgi:DNA-binding FrmR family transcriptional regulator